MIIEAKALWQSLIDNGSAKDSEFKQGLMLHEGAVENELLELEKRLNVKLPDEMKAFYQIHNGQKDDLGVNAFVRNLTLSPISEIIENWAFLQEEFDPDELELEADQKVKPVLWSPSWIPIAHNGGGDYLCLDTDPEEDGRYGQVLYFWHDWGKRAVEAEHLFAFIRMCLEEEID